MQQIEVSSVGAVITGHTDVLAILNSFLCRIRKLPELEYRNPETPTVVVSGYQTEAVVIYAQFIAWG